MKRYSQMTEEELRLELNKLEDQRKQSLAENEQHILEQKINLAQAYMIDPNIIQVESWYRIKGKLEHFHVDYINGVFAWGTLKGSTEQVAFPISLLKTIDQ